MANLSISTAWNETVEFVKRESRLLFPLAFMLIALPSALLRIVMPPPPVPGTMPEPGLWLALVPLVIVATMVGNIAISYLALRPGVSVGEAIQRGLRRFLPLLAAVLLVALAGALLFFVVALVMVLVVPGAMSSAAAGAATSALALATVLAMLLLLPVILYFAARLIAVTPAAAAEEAGPIELIRRSWALTTGHVGKLVAFLLLVAIAVSVLGRVVESLAGILFIALAGPLRPGSLSTVLIALVLAAVNTVVGAYLGSLVARVYAQLSG